MVWRWLLALMLVCPVASTANGVHVVFSHQGGFYNKPFYLTLSCPQGYSIHYTVNGNVPVSSDLLYEGQLLLDESMYSHSDIFKIQCCPDEQWFVPDGVHHCIVVRAAAFDRNGTRCGEVSTNSFFIKSLGNNFHHLPVISLCLDSLSLFDFDSGIFVRGATGTNFNQKGMEWERPCNFEFYEIGSQGLNQQVGLRLHGESSRIGMQKGMRLYARREYSGTRLNYGFFGSDGSHSFKRLVLKPFGRCLLRDYFCTEMARSLDFEIPSSRPVVVFLNGEYWGIYFLKERPDKHYIADCYGYNPDEVSVVESWEGETADGTNKSFVNMMNWLEQADFTNDSIYRQACQIIDINNFIDYYCFQWFVANMDWPLHNMRCWQAYDGKWRWIFFDGDLCLGSTQSILSATIASANNMDASTFLFTRLLTNAEFRDRFYQRFGTLLTHELSSKNTHRVFDSCYAILEDEVDDHFARFGWFDYNSRFDSESRYVDYFLTYRIVTAASMIYTLYYCNDWEYHSSKSSKHVRFYQADGGKPVFLLRMARQFDDWGYVRAYIRYECYRIINEIKSMIKKTISRLT